MSTTTEEKLETVADLVARLGDIPLERILVKPPPGTATEADVLAAEAAPRKRLCELIDGVLVEKAMGFNESRLASVLIELLSGFVRKHNLGIVTAPDGMLRLVGQRVRIPDVAFVSWDSLPGGKAPTKPIPQLAPDLAVEILSASNTPREMELKREDYFGAGTRLVWEIDPARRTARVYHDVDAFDVYDSAGTLHGEEVLPGFTVSLAELFAELDRQKP